jgi:hypothetical protein
VKFAVVGLAVCIEQVVGFVVVVVGFSVVRLAILWTSAGGLAAVRFAVVGLILCIEKGMGLLVVVVSIEEFVVLAVVVVVHPTNLWLMKEGFGRMGQEVNTSGGHQIKTNL